MADPERERIMVVSHGHPAVRPGGGENVAYALFSQFRERPDVDALFVAHEPPRPSDVTVIGQRTPDGSEVFFRTKIEYFRLSQRQPQVVYRDFRSLLEWYRPTVVHFQHFLDLGLELFREVRNYSASVPVVLSLHEFSAICHNDGQMVKLPDRRLCERSSPDDCARCFPEYTPQDFFLRTSYIKSFFDVVDAFVAPSDFLAERYVDWGVPQDKMVRIDNGLPTVAPVGSGREPGPGNRFAFFGQVLPFKGLDVLLEAMTHLSASYPPITLDVHGGRLEDQSIEYQARIAGLLARLRDRVRVHGSYLQSDTPRLMSGVDWVVLPSVWWENSPVVIQEAFANGCPVICADIGGMAEKVRHGVDGLHFQARDPIDLAARMHEAARTPGLLGRLIAGIRDVTTADVMADQHLRLYGRLRGGHGPSAVLEGLPGAALSDG